MAFKLLAVCLAFALAASAQDLSEIHSSLETTVNSQVNQLCDEVPAPRFPICLPTFELGTRGGCCSRCDLL